MVVTCYVCQSPDHIALNCPKRKTPSSGVSHQARANSNTSASTGNQAPPLHVKTCTVYNSNTNKMWLNFDATPVDCFRQTANVFNNDLVPIVCRPNGDELTHEKEVNDRPNVCTNDLNTDDGPIHLIPNYSQEL